MRAPSILGPRVQSAATFTSYLLAFFATLVSHAWSGQHSFIVVSSDFNDSVQMYDLAGNHVRQFVPPGFGGLDSPQGIAVGPDGNVYVSSAVNDRVLRYDGITGAFLGIFANTGGLDQPWYLRFGPDGHLYVSSSLTSSVLCFDGASGAFLRVAASGGGLLRPDGLSFDADGNILVSDFAVTSSRIKKYNPQTGAFLGDVVVDAGLRGPLENRLSADGSTLFVSSFGTSEIRTYDAVTGAFLGTLIAAPPLNGPVGQLELPGGAGLLVTSWNNSSIYRYDAETGALLGTFTSGGFLDHPNNLALLIVPEPASALSFGGMMLAMLMRVRRRGPLA